MCIHRNGPRDLPRMTTCVVAVDDSPTNLLMIDEYLSEVGYSLK